VQNQKEGRLLKLSLNNIRIFDGSIDSDDAPKKTHHAVRGSGPASRSVELQVYVEQYVQPSFSAVVNGKRISLKGKTKPFRRVAGNHLRRDHLGPSDIPYYLEYVPVRRDYVISSRVP